MCNPDGAVQVLAHAERPVSELEDCGEVSQTLTQAGSGSVGARRRVQGVERRGEGRAGEERGEPVCLIAGSDSSSCCLGSSGSLVVLTGFLEVWWSTGSACCLACQLF